MESYSGLSDLADQLRAEIKNYERRVHNNEKPDRTAVNSLYSNLSGSFIGNIKNDLKKIFPSYGLISISDSLILMDRTDHGASYVSLEINFGELKIDVRCYIFLKRIVVYINEIEFLQIKKERLHEIFKHSERDTAKYYAELRELSDNYIN